MVALGGRMRYAPTLPAGEASQVPGKSFPASAEAAYLVSHPEESAHSVHTSLHSVHTSLHSVHTFLFAPLRHPHLCRRTINDNEQWQEYD